MISLFNRSSTRESSRTLLPSLSITLRVELFLILVVICVAAFFRLYHLGEPAFRADTMIFYDYAHQQIGPVNIVLKWIKTQGVTGQFPFAVAWMKLFLSITGAPVTPFMIRLPSAIWGILAVLAVYGCGRILAGNMFAFFLALLFALNPFHIGISREAYFYPPLLCGSALLLWAIILQIKSGRDKEYLPGAFYVLLASGFFLTTYAQPSSWTFAFIAVLIVLWPQVKTGWRQRRIPRSLVWIALIIAVIGTPLLFADWALPQMISATSADHKAYVKRVFGASSESAFMTLARSLFSFSWGRTFPRLIFTIIVLGLSVTAAIRLWRRSSVIPAICALLAGNFLFFAAAKYLLLEQATSSRYLLALLPIYLTWLALGLWFSFDVPSGYRKFTRQIVVVVFSALMIIAIGLNIRPAWLATQLTGKPIPYWDIAHWCDKNLPPRTLVLVERWLDPWNELRVHNSTNVFFTFPVPSEPADVFKQANWPLAARQFMEKYPDAAYLEFFKSERPVKGLATNWPFAKNISFTNEAAIKLAHLGLAHREEFFEPQTNRLIVTIFYNSREDVLANARNSGKQYLVLYGPEWGYVKLWQQLRDFRDWRILENKAALDVYNLTSSTNRVTLKMRGMTLNGTKRVTSEGAFAPAGESGVKQHDFRHLQLEEWELKNITLQPGFNRIVLSDSLWSVAKIPLLVDQAEISSSPQATQ